MSEIYYQESQQIDVDKAWEKLRFRLQEDDLVASSAPKRRLMLTPGLKWMVAAIVMVCLTTGLIYFLIPGRHHVQMLSMQNDDHGNTLVKTLEDGSTVYLASRSSLNYPAKFTADSRDVAMQGDALFDIAKNPAKPFRIETEKVVVEVLGTAFNVQSNGKDPFRLTVLRGKVKVTQKTSGEMAYVVAGESITSVDDHWIKSENANRKLLDNFIRNMRFKDEALARIVQVVNQYSAQKIALRGEEIKERRLNVQFYNNDADGISKVISLALHLKREVHADSIYISQP